MCNCQIVTNMGTTSWEHLSGVVIELNSLLSTYFLLASASAIVVFQVVLRRSVSDLSNLRTV
jgi:hypothetical protein